MKKVFISCPMKGRTTENIAKTMDKMHKYAELVLEEECEVIPSYVPNHTVLSGANERVWLLGCSIKCLSEADVLVRLDIPNWVVASGCQIEARVAMAYGIEILHISSHSFKYFCPDLTEQLGSYNDMYNTTDCLLGESEDE